MLKPSHMISRALILGAILLAAACRVDAAEKPLDSLMAADARHTDIYSKYAPAVVAITCNLIDEKATRPAERRKPYIGTGAVVSPDGWILTSITSVPKGARDIKVYFIDGHVRSAEAKSVDETTEGTMIKVDAKDLPFMRVSESKDYKVGDAVYTWGNPFQSIQKDGVVSFSSGSISGLYAAASFNDESRYAGTVIETDAAVNPASDGGPLTDSDGNVIGVLSLAYSRTRWQGLAIPTSVIAEKLADLKAIVKPRRSSLTAIPTPASMLHSALEQASQKPGKAVITIRVVREGDKTEAPEDFRKLEVKRVDENIPPRDEVALYEMRRPADAYATGFLVTADGVAVTANFNLDEREKEVEGVPRRMRQRPGGPGVPRYKTNKIKKIYVYMADGKRYEAKMLGFNQADDIAAIKLDIPAGTKLPFVDMDASVSELPTGSSVAILGRSEPPGDLTVNAGRVSGECRFNKTCNQVNALVNYGNIGGPAVNLDGKVVGIAAKLSSESDWRQNCGVGFLVLSSQIKKLLPDLIAGNNVEKSGVQIGAVLPDTAASKAGIKVGDVVLQYNGNEVHSWESFIAVTGTLKPGDKATLKVRRGKETVELTAELGERTDEAGRKRAFLGVSPNNVE